jgi:hypothetical protein
MESGYTVNKNRNPAKTQVVVPLHIVVFQCVIQVTLIHFLRGH